MTDTVPRRPEIQRLVATRPGRYENVPADATHGAAVLDGVAHSELDLVIVGTDRGRHTRALTLAYDAARKSVEAVMLAMGLRVGRGEGGHAAIAEFAEAEFIESPAESRDARAFATARIVRNADEYPRPGDVERSRAELRTLTQACVRLVGHCRTRLGLDPRLDLVPTDAKVRAYLAADE